MQSTSNSGSTSFSYPTVIEKNNTSRIDPHKQERIYQCEYMLDQSILETFLGCGKWYISSNFTGLRMDFPFDHKRPIEDYTEIYFLESSLEKQKCKMNINFRRGEKTDVLANIIFPVDDNILLRAIATAHSIIEKIINKEKSYRLEIATDQDVFILKNKIEAFGKTFFNSLSSSTTEKMTSVNSILSSEYASMPNSQVFIPPSVYFNLQKKEQEAVLNKNGILIYSDEPAKIQQKTVITATKRTASAALGAPPLAHKKRPFIPSE